MSARNYMPYIEGALEHINNIYEWNKRVDEMRAKVLGIPSIEDYYTFGTYNFKNGLRLYYEERGEYTDAILTDKPLDAVDAIIDQFVVAIGEIRKCALGEEYQYIEQWEEKANKAYADLLVEVRWRTGYTGDQALHQKRDQALTKVINALFTRFGDDAYIDENGKFIKSKGYTKPDLSFLV